MHARSSANGGRRRWAVVALSAVTLASAIVASGGGTAAVHAQTPPKPEAASPEAELAAAAGPEATVVEGVDGGPVTFVGTPPGDAVALSDGGATPRAAAQAFVEEFGAAFGEAEPAEDLTVDRTTPMAAGGKAVHYQQLEGGVPILAGELNVQVAPGGKVRSAGGELSTGAAVDTVPDVSSEAATDTALASVASDAGVSVELLTADAPALWVYDPSLVDEAGPRHLVWRLEVRSDVAPVRVEVLVDAHTGEVTLALDLLMHARDREVCDNQNIEGDPYECPAAGVARSEGQAATGVTEVDRAYELSGATYDYYATNLGRDSIDGAGMTLFSTVRHCPTGECPYQNAFWDGFQMVYGDTFAGSDDVVAHELTHGVTENESNLVYLNQSGAINESLSDVFGEFLDLTYDSTFDNDDPSVRWEMGEDLPGIGAIRDMEDPGRAPFGDPDRMGSPNYYTGIEDGGGVHTNSGVNNKAAFLMTDGQTFNGITVSPLGITKVARIYYEAQVNILTSGSNYAALGAALPQACNNLVGVVGITAGDCQEVVDAVTATEMVQSAPANDNFANATTISGTSGTTTGNTSFATRETGEPVPSGASPNGWTNPSASIWFRFTAAGSGTASINTCNSELDTMLAAFTGASVGALTTVANNDDGTGLSCSGSPFWSKIDFAVTQGTTYSVAVDGYNTQKGAVTLNWTLPAAPAPTGVSGTVTETGTGTPVGGAMVAVLNSSTFAIAGGGVADGSGNYSAQVPAGSYYLYVIDPSGGHTTGFFGAPTPVTVTAGVMVDRDPTMASARGALGGTVSPDSPAGALGGAWALAVGANGDIEAGAVANGSGLYSIANLAAGSYKAVFLDPTGAHRSEFFPNSSDPAAATTIAVSGGATATANVSLANQSAGGSGQSLAGTVTQAGTGAGLANVLVLALRSSDLSLARAAVTNGSGAYSMGVDTGTYKLGFVDTAGLHLMEWFDNQPNNGLAAATNVSAPAVRNADLARRNGSITGTVTADGSAAALTGVWVLAIDATGKIAGGAATAGNGTYTISGLRAGTYRVTFVDPVGGHTQEFFDNSPTSIGATPVVVTGGATATANAGLHHP